jgi:peptidoglycan/LPS O-acetylase OafA/YrhL
MPVPLPPERSRPSDGRGNTKSSGTHLLSYRPDIDGLRAVAVLSVVAFHAGIPAFRGGFTGVDIFFVLSGYLISGIIIRALETGTFSFRDFYARRINRIFPALIIMLLGTFVLGWYLLFRSEFLNLGKHIAAGATFLSNAALVQESGYFDIAAARKPLLNLWSLAIEEQFYLIWPLLLVVCWRFRPRFFLPALLIGLGSYLLAMIAAYTEHSATSFFLPFTRLWELVAGFALFTMEAPPGEPRRVEPANARAWIGLALIAISIFFISQSVDWPGIWTLIPVAGTVILVSAGPASWVSRNLLSRTPMVWIGLISYPLYLWHWPLLSFARIIENGHENRFLLGSALVLSFVLAFLTYKLIEFPIRARASGRGTRAILLVGLLALVGVAGGMAGRGKISTRLDSPGIRAIQSAIGDWGYPGGGKDMLGRMHVNIIAGNRDTVLFAGDSHMEQYWPRMDTLIRGSAGTLPTAIFLTERACPTLPGVGRKDVPACSTLYETIMERAKSPSVRGVVLTSYWSDFFQRNLLYRLGDDERNPIGLSEPVTDSIFANFERDISHLVASGKKVFVVLTIPIGGNSEFDPKSWLPGRLDANDKPRIIPDISLADYRRREEPVLRRVRISASRAGAVVLDPVRYMCSTTSCATIDAAGDPLYMDARHLRASVARTKAVWMDETLR